VDSEIGPGGGSPVLLFAFFLLVRTSSGGPPSCDTPSAAARRGFGYRMSRGQLRQSRCSSNRFGSRIDRVGREALGVAFPSSDPGTTVMRIALVRFKLRSAMVVVATVAILAAAVVAWTRVDRSEWRQQLDSEVTWTQSPVGEFFVEHQIDENVSTILKVSEFLAADGEGRYYGHRWWIGRGGELRDYRTFRTGSGSHGAGAQNHLTVAELAHVQQLISDLPPPNVPPSQVDLLLVASSSNGYWVTRVYDKAALPPAVRGLVRVLQQPEAITSRSRPFSAPER
jgi:hypothetical protein